MDVIDFEFSLMVDEKKILFLLRHRLVIDPFSKFILN